MEAALTASDVPRIVTVESANKYVIIYISNIKQNDKNQSKTKLNAN